MEICPICSECFFHIEQLYSHFRNKRKNKEHSNYINEHVKESFDKDDPMTFLETKKLKFSRSSLNSKWHRWYSKEEIKRNGNLRARGKNSKRVWTEEQKKNVSDGLLRAYASGKKTPPMKGKVAHNKGKPCSEEQKNKIRETLLRKYANNEIKISNNGNNYRHGYRHDISHFCRSSWEANICRFLKNLGIVYVYEYKRFKLQHEIGVLTYIPDIFIPSRNLFIEIKGRYSDSSKLKHLLFKQQHPQYKLAIITREKYFKIERRLYGKILNWEISASNKYCVDRERRKDKARF